MKEMEKERHIRVRKKGIELISKGLISKERKRLKGKEKKARIGSSHWIRDHE